VNTAPGCELAHLDGAYVLGALSPEERLEFERHLSGCPGCARSVQQLAGLPGLLSQVSVDVLAAEPVEEPVPTTLLPALVREVRRSQHRRRWVTGVVAAAAVLVVAAGSVTVAHTLDDQPGQTAASPGRDMTQLGQDSVVANVALTSVAWGTRLELICTYDESEPGYAHHGEPTYTLVVRSRDGDVQEVGSWKGLPGKTMSLTGASSMAADDIASVEVRTADGRPILELDG
jgi:hypothetical protein